MVKLFVNDIELDMIDFDWSITANQMTVEDFGNAKGSKSESINVPLTPNNITALGGGVFANAYDKTQLYNCKIVGGLYTLKGYLKVYRVEKKQNIKIAVCQFLTANAGFIENIKDKSMQDLNLNDSAFSFELQTVENSWANTYNYIFDFCSRGTREVSGYWQLNELYPAFRITYLLNKIFNGYTIDSDFFDANPDLFLLFTQNRQIFNSENWKSYNTFNVSCNHTVYNYNGGYGVLTSPVKIGTTLINFSSAIGANSINGGAFDNANNKYVVSESGTIKIDANINIRQTVTTTASVYLLTLNIYLIHKRGSTETILITQTLSKVNTTDVFIFTLKTGYLYCNTGDEFYIKVNGTAAWSGGDIATLILTADNATNSFQSTPSRWLGSGQFISQPSILLPLELTQTDFLKGLFQLFNLQMAVDENFKTVKIETKDTFFSNNAIDITNYIDESKDYTIQYPEKKRFKLKMQDDSNDGNITDGFVNFLFDDLQTGYPEQQIEITTFAPTIVDIARDTPINYQLPICPILHKNSGKTNGNYYDAEYNTEFQYRIVQFVRLDSFSWTIEHGALNTNAGYQTQSETEYPYFDTYNEIKSLVTRTQNLNEGVERYYKNQFFQINNGYKLEVYANIPDTLLFNLFKYGSNSINSPVLIQKKGIEGIYEIEKIEQIRLGEHNSVKFYLFKRFNNTKI